jgi:hypothetical protein
MEEIGVDGEVASDGQGFVCFREGGLDCECCRLGFILRFRVGNFCSRFRSGKVWDYPNDVAHCCCCLAVVALVNEEGYTSVIQFGNGRPLLLLATAC